MDDDVGQDTGRDSTPCEQQRGSVGYPLQWLESSLCPEVVRGPAFLIAGAVGVVSLSANHGHLYLVHPVVSAYTFVLGDVLQAVLVGASVGVVQFIQSALVLACLQYQSLVLRVMRPVMCS